MAVLSRSIYVLAVVEAVVIAFATIYSYAPVFKTFFQLLSVICIFVATIMIIFGMRKSAS